MKNSRPRKKQPIIWRRRACPRCGAIFTTHERPSLAENKPVHQQDGTKEQFNLGKLILSIARAFSHQKKEAEHASYPLAQTVEDILSTQYKTITAADIESVTHSVLKKYDELAAVQYAAQHQLIVSIRRRGRPSLRGRVQQTDVSPSL